MGQQRSDIRRAAPFTMTSPAFGLGEPIPARHTCDGDNDSPGARVDRAARGHPLARGRDGGPGRTLGRVRPLAGVGPRPPPPRVAGGGRAALRGAQRLRKGGLRGSVPADRGPSPRVRLSPLRPRDVAGPPARVADGRAARVPRRGVDRGDRADRHVRPAAQARRAGRSRVSSSAPQARSALGGSTAAAAVRSLPSHRPPRCAGPGAAVAGGVRAWPLP